MPLLTLERAYSTPLCEMVLQTMGPVLTVVCSGHLDAISATRMATGVTALRRNQAKVYLFLNWYKITGYDTEARKILTNYKKANQRKDDESFVLVGSKIVAMGVTAANAVLGGNMQITSDPQVFDKQRNEVLAKIGSSVI